MYEFVANRNGRKNTPTFNQIFGTEESLGKSFGESMYSEGLKTYFAVQPGG